MRSMDPKAVLRMLDAAGRQATPREIVEHKEKIEAETRVLQLRASVGGSVDAADVKRIVQMKLDLDGLYADWAESL